MNQALVMAIFIAAILIIPSFALAADSSISAQSRMPRSFWDVWGAIGDLSNQVRSLQSDMRGLERIKQGPAGDDGKGVVVSVSIEPPGTNCTNGGYRIDFYRDVNNNGKYEQGKDKPLLSTSFSCNGAGGGSGSGTEIDPIFTAWNSTYKCSDMTTCYPKLDTDGTDDFSGSYEDLANKPDFTNWDKNATDDFQCSNLTACYPDLDTNQKDDFSGDYTDLKNAPDFTAWDKNAADDFDGKYDSLTNKPEKLSEFTDDIGVSADYDECSDISSCGLSDDEIDPIWNSDKAGYYNKTESDARFVKEGQTDSITSAMIMDGVIGASDIDSSQVQRRIDGTCAVGSSIREISSDGTVTCETDDSGGVNGWEIISSTSLSNTTGTKIWTTTCSSGKKILGGGATVSVENNDKRVIKSYPSGDDSWTAQAYSGAGSGDWSITVYAICATVN